MSSHTPGPWGTQDGAEVWPMEGPTSFVTLARVTGPWCDSQWYGSVEESRANGRLIAAAPELLAALIACREQLAVWVDTGSLDEADFAAVKMADEAIRKAVG